MYHSKDVLNSFAKIASDAYLGKSKTPLNDSLEKIAKTEGLEPHQIEYVASQTNNSVWQSLFGMDKKASYDFPLADPSYVIEKLQVKAKPVVKEASVDYMSAPVKFVHEKTASGCVDDGVDREKAQRRAVKKELEHRLEKAANAKELLSDKMTKLASESQVLVNTFVKEAREMVMQTAFLDRGEAMMKIAEFVNSAIEGDAKVGIQLMSKLAEAVKKSGLVKEADLKAPEEYISKTLPARIVNGRHSLYITIKTLRDKVADWENCERTHEIVDSSLPFIKEKIRAL